MKILKNTQLIRFIAILLLLLTLTTPLVYAHDAAYLQVLIDPDNLKYTSNVVADKPGFSREGAHMEAKTGNFIDLKNTKNKPLKGMELDKKAISKFTEEEIVGLEEDDKKLKKNSKDDGYIFTFPSKEEGGFFGKKNDATSADVDRAYEIGGTLVNNLNSILTTVNNGNKFTDVNHLSNTSIYIRPSSGDTAIIPSRNGTDYYITYATEQGKIKKTQEEINKAIKNGITKDSLFTYYPKSDKNNNLYAYVYEVDKTTNIIKNMKQFIWAMPKGYIPITGNQKDAIIPNSYKYLNGFNPNDTAWLTIHQLSYQGNFNYVNHDLMSAKSGVESEVGLLEGAIYQLVTSIFYGITSILGLYDIEELVFNEGFRGTALFNDGMMNQDWWNVVLRYHMIFQVIAWTLLIGAVIKILIQVHFSTINPSLRISIMETIQKLFVVGFLLVSIIPTVQLMATMNSSIVDIFSTQVDWSSSGRIANHSNILAGLFIEVIYLMISIYVNFVYIMRSIMIAILIASGPFFVVSMAYSMKGKGLFDNWTKELLANIFLQGFHAFAFAFILNVQGGSRGIEELVVAASLIPLTEFFRSMIFGQSGSFAISQGKSLTTQATKLGTTGAEALTQGLKNSSKTYKETSHKGGESSSSSSADLGIKRNSDRIRENTSSSDSTGSSTSSSATSKGGKALKAIGETLKAGAEIGNSAIKLGAGVALGDNQLMMSGANDFKDILSGDRDNGIKSLPPPEIPNYDDNGVLGYRETGTTKQPIRSKQYLQDRGLDMKTYKGGATMLIQDRSKLLPDDLNNLMSMESNWNHPDTDRNMFLKKNGIDNILTNKDGHITSIGYNTNGLKQLGISKIQEKDHFGEKALYEDRLNNNNTPNYTYKPIQTLKQATDN